MGRSIRVISLLIAAVALALGLAACGAGSPANDPNPLTLAVVPAESSAALQQQFTPLARFIGRLVGRRVIIISTASYADTIQALRFKKADIALLGPLSYIVARSQGVAIEPVGAQVSSRGGPPSYRSVAVVADASPLTSLAMARRRRVCFADPTSTSGYLYPYQALLRLGLQPGHEVASTFLGGPDKTALAAAKGTCDVGFSFDDLVEKVLVSTREIRSGQLRVIWRSTPIPGSPLVIRADLDSGLRQRLSGAILRANTDAFRAAGLCPSRGPCGVSGVYGYAPVSDSFYDTVRRACQATGIPACRVA